MDIMIFKQLFDQETWTYTYLIADPVNSEYAAGHLELAVPLPRGFWNSR